MAKSPSFPAHSGIPPTPIQTASFAAVEQIADGNLGEDRGGYRHEFLELVRTARDLTAFGE